LLILIFQVFIQHQIADTQVTPYSGGSDINLFDCNAVIDTSQKLIDNVQEHFLKECEDFYLMHKVNIN
jgi:hypothetical protein